MRRLMSLGSQVVLYVFFSAPKSPDYLSQTFIKSFGASSTEAHVITPNTMVSSLLLCTTVYGDITRPELDLLFHLRKN